MTLRFSIAILFVTMVSCQPRYVLDENIKVNNLDYATSKPDSALIAMVAPYKTKLDAEMNTVIGYLAENLEKGFPEGKLGNFAADVFFDSAMDKFNKSAAANFWNATNALCIINNGGLRVNLQKGAVSKGKIFELLPFENYLTVFQFKGKYLLNELAKYIADKKGQPVSKNVKIKFEQGTLVSFEISGVQVDSAKTYCIITNDYLANGGDNMDLFARFKNDKDRMDFSELRLRDCMIEYMQSHSNVRDSIKSITLGRIEIK